MTDFSYPLPLQLALAHAGQTMRPVLAAFFDLDQRLAQFVSQAKEPILTQMRIAWWRDQLRKTPADRPQGDPILDVLTSLWSGEESALIALVDGWEGLLAEPPLPDATASEFAVGRGACFAAIARLHGQPEASKDAQAAGEIWAWADLVSKLSDSDERDHVVAQACSIERDAASLPYQLRALTILQKLAARSLDKGGGGLIAGRSDLLLVSRIGLIGR